MVYVHQYEAAQATAESEETRDSTNKTRSAPAQVYDIRLVGLGRRYPP